MLSSFFITQLKAKHKRSVFDKSRSACTLNLIATPTGRFPAHRHFLHKPRFSTLSLINFHGHSYTSIAIYVYTLERKPHSWLKKIGTSFMKRFPVPWRLFQSSYHPDVNISRSLRGINSRQIYFYLFLLFCSFLLFSPHLPTVPLPLLGLINLRYSPVLPSRAPLFQPSSCVSFLKVYTCKMYLKWLKPRGAEGVDSRLERIFLVNNIIEGNYPRRLRRTYANVCWYKNSTNNGYRTKVP